MGVFDLFFPKFCLVCRQNRAEEALVLCVHCAANLAFQPYEENRPHPMLEQARLTHPVIQAYAPFIHNGTKGGFIRVLHELKYAKRTFLAKELVALAQPGLQAFFNAHRFDVMAAMPMHFTKWLQRGFNQSALIAYEISKKNHVPFDHHLLRQVRPKKSQASKTQEERRKMNDQLFKANRKKVKNYDHILVVDDVFTTGSTLAACFNALQQQRVAKVSYLTLFYTPLEYTGKSLLQP
ncbi:MAG: hypothetical protein RLZZ242_531 [Bacteroidota bacterium]